MHVNIQFVFLWVIKNFMCVHLLKNYLSNTIQLTIHRMIRF